MYICVFVYAFNVYFLYIENVIHLQVWNSTFFLICRRSKMAAEKLEALSTCSQTQTSLAAKPQNNQLENPAESEWECVSGCVWTSVRGRSVSGQEPAHLQGTQELVAPALLAEPNTSGSADLRWEPFWRFLNILLEKKPPECPHLGT